MTHRMAWLSLVACLLMVSCSANTAPTTPDSSEPTTQTNCATLAGYPVVWAKNWDPITASDLEDLEEVLQQAQLSLVSAYWARTPNHIYDIAPESRACVGSEDRWMLVSGGAGPATSRWKIPFDSPREFDPELWGQIAAHPWQLVRQGPIGTADQAPHYKGIVTFTDELAVTQSACDTRSNVVMFRGDALTPMEWPISEQTMVCASPPGAEPLPETEAWYLPIGGVPSIEGDELVITHAGLEYRYAAISKEEFLRSWQEDGFFPIRNPLTILDETEANSFGEIDRGEVQVTDTTEP